MKEFCNFQNCGLSFTLFNKLVWALIMENCCREKESERERARENEREREGERERKRERKTFGSLWIHFPFLKMCFCRLLFRDFLHYHSVLVRQQTLDSNRESFKNGYKKDMRYIKVRKWSPSISLSATNMES